MKRILSLAAILILSAVCVSHAQEKSLKVAVVDMSRVLKEYYKTEAAQKRITELANGYQNDLKDRREGYLKLVDEIKRLKETLDDKSISADKKKEVQAAMEEKIRDAGNKELEQRNFINQSSRLLDDQRRTANDGIMGEISKAVSKVSKEKGMNLVLVKAEFPSPVLYSDIADISTEIIAELNKDKPKSATP